MSISFKVFPLQTNINSGFRVSSPVLDSRFHPTLSVFRPHKGVDIPATIGTGIVAVADGEIIEIRGTPYTSTDSTSAGKYIEIRHDSLDQAGRKYITRYLHMNSIEPGLVKGRRIRAGQRLGTVGKTGASKGPHLHMELLNGNRDPVDPTPYLAIAAASTGVPFNQTNTAVQPPSLAITNEETTTAVVRYAGGRGSVTPYIALTDSFHPKIQYELTKRRLGSETATVYMPFTKLTALIKVKPTNIQGNAVQPTPIQIVDIGRLANIPIAADAYCPSIGVHDRPEVSFDNMYLPQDNKSIVGYTTIQGTNGPERVAMVVEDGAYDAPNLPPPGITSMTIERSTAGPMGVRGGLYRANLKITAHSVGQLNALLTYFIRPGTRVVLEIGHRKSSETSIPTYNWKQSFEEIKSDFQSLVLGGKDEKNLLKTLVHANFGNYEMLLGYVVDFKLSYDSNNRYNIDLTVHSLQQFEIPLKNTGTRALCTTRAVVDDEKVVGIDEYFSPEENWKGNTLTKLLEEVGDVNSSMHETWKNDIIPLKGVGTDSTTTGGFLVTWRFFIDVILNDSTKGVMSVFNLRNSDEQTTYNMLKAGIMPKFSPEHLDVVPNAVVDGQVGWHPSLRSSNPDVMLIFNPIAQQNKRVVESIAEANTRNEFKLTDTDEHTETVSGQILAKSNNLRRFNKISKDSNISSLYTGVWLNTNGIIKAFENADTFTQAMANLITAMNSATEGYWNLQLISDDVNSPGLHVVDMALSKPNTQTIMKLENEPLISATIDRRDEILRSLQGRDEDSPKYLYKFNRKLKTFDSQNTDETLGGELLNINIQSGLPHVVAVQAIAGVGGLGQRGTLASINVDELKALSMFDTYPTCVPQAGEVTTPAPSNETVQKYISDSEAMTLARDAYIKGLPEVESTVVKSFIAQKRDAGHRELAFDTGNIRTLISARINHFLTQMNDEYAQRNSGMITLIKNYANSFGRALEFIEWNKAAMLKEMDESSTSENENINSFNSSNLTKTIVELTMPGIGGIELFQAFEVDRVPSFLNRGYYVVTKVNHDFTTQKGWTTKITGRFRFKPQDETIVE